MDQRQLGQPRGDPLVLARTNPMTTAA